MDLNIYFTLNSAMHFQFVIWGRSRCLTVCHAGKIVIKTHTTSRNVRHAGTMRSQMTPIQPAVSVSFLYNVGEIFRNLMVGIDNQLIM